MAKTLKLSSDLTFPLDAVTQTFLVVGKRGSGKSNTAARFVEQLHHARLPFVVLDPVDTWWGLKAGIDGGRGLDVYVFGGRKQDLPLNETDGALIADVLCEHRVSMVLSVKHLSGRARSRFMVAFAQTLFQKWGGGPLHVVLEEAHELAPQMGGSRTNDTDGDAAMLGAFKRLWKLGRASGIGGTAVTQRPASLSKDITTQSEILIAHRTIGPQDVKAIGEWVKYHGEQQEILADLPSLPTGQAFVWAPEFPEGQPIGLKRVTVLRRETYDSASTPKVGEQIVEPKELTEVDLDVLKTKMAQTIERAKADDPKELKRRIAELEREVKKKAVEILPAGRNTQTGIKAPVEILTEADRATLADLVAVLRELNSTFTGGDAQSISTIQAKAENAILESLGRFRSELNDLVVKRHEQFTQRLERAGFTRILEKLERVKLDARIIQNRPVFARPEKNIRENVNSHSSRNSNSKSLGINGNGTIKGGAFRSMLVALAQAGRPLADNQVAARAGMALSGTFDKYLGQQRTHDWVEGPRTALVITPDGLQALGAYDPLPTGIDLQRYWLDYVGGGKKREMLSVLIHAYPRSLSDTNVAGQADMALSGTFDKYLGQLRTLQLVTGPRSALSASEELFN